MILLCIVKEHVAEETACMRFFVRVLLFFRFDINDINTEGYTKTKKHAWNKNNWKKQWLKKCNNRQST